MARDAVSWWIVSPRHASAVPRDGWDGPPEWCYLGTNTGQRARVAKALAFARERPVGEAVTRLAHELRQPFLDWIGEAGAKQPDPVAWWGSALASKSPLQIDLFLLVCYAELVRSWVREGQETAGCIVVVEHPWLASLLRQHLAGDPRVACRGVGWSWRARDAAAWVLKMLAAASVEALWGMKAMAAVRWTFRGTADPMDGLTGRAVLICSWIQPRCLAEPGRLADPWTGRLGEILTAHGERVKRLTPLQVPSPLLPSLRAFAPSLIVTLRHVTAGDLLRAVSSRFRLRHLRCLSRFRGWDYAILLSAEELRERGQSHVTHGRLFCAAMRRIARRYGAKVKCLIYPFENQPWEKLLCLAWREQAPHVALVGYQHTWVPPLLLPYGLGARERQIAPLPDRIVANSEWNLRALKAGGFPEETLFMGGALRHEHLHRSTNGGARDPRSAASASTQPPAVLVAFPLHKAHASRLLTDLLEEFRRPLMVNGAAEPVRFALKLHPSFPLRQFCRRPPALPPWIAWSDEPLSQSLAEADLLLYAGPTSTGWEAALSGVPVLKYQSDLLDIDAGHELDGLSIQACTRATMRGSISRFLGERARRSPPDPLLIREAFGMVDEALWRAVVRPVA
ncbi:MAG: hypothetical protein HYT90_00855 [Candidatus Omnitrophica bacterium]|nr:hypothetical protein [Candidatus Omnitrophota bacterium]